MAALAPLKRLGRGLALWAAGDFLGLAFGGTGSTTAAGARSSLGAAASGANSDITSLTGLSSLITSGNASVGGALTVAGSIYSGSALYANDRNGNGHNAALYRNNDLTRLWDNAYGDVIAYDATGAVTIYNKLAISTPLAVSSGGTGATTAAGALASLGLTTVLQPQGRLTLTSGQPVMQGAVSAATAVLYTPYLGNMVPCWNGTVFVPTIFAETSQALSDATKSPVSAAASAIYDMFAWNDAGTFRVTRGPAWSAGATAGSNAVRGSGAGSTVLTRVQGILVNAVAIANGPAAGFGTYLGTIATDSSGATVSWSFGGSAAGGIAAILNVWNAYNRRTVAARVLDTNQPYAVSSSAFRNYANSAAMRVTFVCGLAEDSIPYQARTNVNVGTAAYHLGVSLNGTQIADQYVYNVTASGMPLPLSDSIAGAVGANILQLIEASSSSVTVNSNGENSFNAQLAM